MRTLSTNNQIATLLGLTIVQVRRAFGGNDPKYRPEVSFITDTQVAKSEYRRAFHWEPNAGDDPCKMDSSLPIYERYDYDVGNSKKRNRRRHEVVLHQPVDRCLQKQGRSAGAHESLFRLHHSRA